MQTDTYDLTDALFLMTSALSTLDQGEAPFEVKAYLDFAIHRLAEFVAPNEHGTGQAKEISNANWLN